MLCSCTYLIFSSCSFRAAAPAIWNSRPPGFLPFYLTDSTLSDGTQNTPFSEQRSESPPSGELQRLQFTHMTNGTF